MVKDNLILTSIIGTPFLLGLMANKYPFASMLNNVVLLAPLALGLRWHLDEKNKELQDPGYCSRLDFFGTSQCKGYWNYGIPFLLIGGEYFLYAVGKRITN